MSNNTNKIRTAVFAFGLFMVLLIGSLGSKQAEARTNITINHADNVTVNNLGSGEGRTVKEIPLLPMAKPETPKMDFNLTLSTQDQEVLKVESKPEPQTYSYPSRIVSVEQPTGTSTLPLLLMMFVGIVVGMLGFSYFSRSKVTASTTAGYIDYLNK